MSNLDATRPTSAVDARADRLGQLAAVLVTALIGAALFLTGFWVGSARGGSAQEPGAYARPVPDWFLPIWDAYDRNPRVTPEFDFALLYDARPRRLARAVERGPESRSNGSRPSSQTATDTKGE